MLQNGAKVGQYDNMSWLHMIVSDNSDNDSDEDDNDDWIIYHNNENMIILWGKKCNNGNS